MHIRPLVVLLLVCIVSPALQGQEPRQTQGEPQTAAGNQVPAQVSVPPQAQQQLQAQAKSQTQPQAEAGAPGLLQRGEALLNEGKLPEALAVLQEAVAAEPHSAQAFQRLGGAQLMSQDYAGSIESFQRAISLDATNVAAFVGLGMAYLHSGRFGQARAAMVEAKRLDPGKQAKLDEIIAWIDQRVSP